MQEVKNGKVRKVSDKRYLTHLQTKYFLKFSEAYETRNHGITSCLVLMKNLVFFLETDSTLDTQKPLEPIDAKQFLIRRNILQELLLRIVMQ